jgi:hypothetical protein
VVAGDARDPKITECPEYLERRRAERGRVSKADGSIHTDSSDVAEHGLERNRVPVDVGDERDSQGSRSLP